jgi:hypothetical protein
MNQLSNVVVDFVRYRRADGAARGLTAPDVGGRRAGLLTCRWRRDVVTGRLICCWTTQRGSREAQPPSRRSLAA